MFNDNVFDRLARRYRCSRREEPNEFLRTSGGRKKGSSQYAYGSLKNSTINRSAFVEQQVINDFVAGITTGTTTDVKPTTPRILGADPMFERVRAYANLDASVYSIFPFPPPTCHPRTRRIIRSRLFTWLDDPDRKRNLIWLHGPAGIGKSTIAQTFAERCAEKGRLGASFFFSWRNDRNDPDTVIPTLVYQLAVCHPPYKALAMAQLANDPAILVKTRRAQFQKLIVEPFSQLQAQEQQRIQKPLLVVLDGLDECKGENTQKEIVEMISEVTRLKKDFPLVWLICSRPESHLKYLFSRADITVRRGREELAIDAESFADVNFYIRDGLVGIKLDFSDFIPSPVWPPEEQIFKLLRNASGNFKRAAASLRYVGDPASLDPVNRLNILHTLIRGRQSRLVESSGGL